MHSLEIPSPEVFHFQVHWNTSISGGLHNLWNELLSSDENSTPVEVTRFFTELGSGSNNQVADVPYGGDDSEFETKQDVSKMFSYLSYFFITSLVSRLTCILFLVHSDMYHYHNVIRHMTRVVKLKSKTNSSLQCNYWSWTGTLKRKK